MIDYGWYYRWYFSDEESELMLWGSDDTVSSQLHFLNSVKTWELS